MEGDVQTGGNKVVKGVEKWKDVQTGEETLCVCHRHG